MFNNEIHVHKGPTIYPLDKDAFDVHDVDQTATDFPELNFIVEHVGLPTPTGPVWNLTDIWRNILEGLTKAGSHCRENKIRLSSVGVDAWGVDWALLGHSGELLALPHCYRDPQNNSARDRVFAAMIPAATSSF